jgi:hypothetical protein
MQRYLEIGLPAGRVLPNTRKIHTILSNFHRQPGPVYEFRSFGRAKGMPPRPNS